MVTKEQVVEKLKTIFDPEIPVNIYDLGLIYDVGVQGADVAVKMTLTSRFCPAATAIPTEVEKKIKELGDVASAKVDVVWEPLWNKDRISPEGRKALKMDEPEDAEARSA